MNATIPPQPAWSLSQTNPSSAPALSRPARRMEGAVLHLLTMAKENPWWTFTVEELAAITGYSRDAISAAKEHGARFPFGKSRPEWVMEWMAAHPRASLKNPLGEEPSRVERR